jgi:hypothetical protein
VADGGNNRISVWNRSNPTATDWAFYTKLQGSSTTNYALGVAACGRMVIATMHNYRGSDSFTQQWDCDFTVN